MAQLNDLFVSGSARFLKTIGGTVSQAVSDENGNNIASTYMKKGVDYVTAGKKSGTTLGTGATAEGSNNTASGNYSHAEGDGTSSLGIGTHAEGSSTSVSDYTSGSSVFSYSHVEGAGCTVVAGYSHAEGNHCTITNCMYSHAEGSYTSVTASAGHAEGYNTSVTQSYSTACGLGTIANGYNQLVIGTYNVVDANSVFIIGYGEDDSHPETVFKVSKKGMITTSKGVVPSSRLANVATIPNLLTDLRYLNGAIGSVSITTAYTRGSVTIATGWYNYIYIPHRIGGTDGAAASGNDNCNYGGLFLFGMTVGGAYFIRFTSGSIAAVRKFYSA